MPIRPFENEPRRISRYTLLHPPKEVVEAAILATLLAGCVPHETQTTTNVAKQSGQNSETQAAAVASTSEGQSTDAAPLQVTAPAEIQKMVDENPDIQAAIAGAEWDGEASGFVKKDANGEITDWFDVEKAHWVRVTQIKQIQLEDGSIVDVYFGTSLTEDQLKKWEELADLLGPAPRNPGIYTKPWGPVKDWDPGFAGLWENALKAKGVPETTPLNWYSVDKNGKKTEHQGAVKSRKLFVNICMGPDDFVPLATPVSEFIKKGWVPVYDWAEAPNKNFQMALVMNTTVHGDRLVLNIFPVTLDQDNRDAGVIDANILKSAMVVAAEQLRQGRVFDTDGVVAYQQQHELLIEAQKYAYRPTNSDGIGGLTVVLDVTK